jgi:hypothetical protein
MSKVTCDTKILDSMIRQVSKGDRSARIGFFDDSGKHPRSGATACEIAAINNFGAPESNIPERPFVTDGAYERELLSQDILRKGVRQAHQGRKTFRKSLTEAAEAQKESIGAQLQLARFVYQGNAQSTVDSKGFNAPLFETGWLQKQIDIKYD